MVSGTVELAPGTDLKGWGQTSPEEFLSWYETTYPGRVRVAHGAAAVRDFFDIAAKEGRTVGVRNCYPHWAANDRAAAAGKLHFVDATPRPAFHACFLDDNVDSNPEEGVKGIVDNRRFGDPEHRLSLQDCFGRHMIPASPMELVRDVDYFAKRIADAEARPH